ncbi:MAG: hypothetical protein KatS3mg015_1816 [Fimbriimonadales bacterium]|nr:MAG: hypothetical protein KatS3mg015_1816 [Fimbriimonadales bacterium]
MEVVKALEELRAHLENTRQFLGITLGFNKEECAVILRKIHALLPDEIRQAAHLHEKAERELNAAKQEAETIIRRAKAEATSVVEEARKEAEEILDHARSEQERLVAETEVVRQAKQTATRIVNEANVEADRLRRDADQYAHDVLAKLESVVTRVLGNVEKGRLELERSLSAPETKSLPEEDGPESR